VLLVATVVGLLVMVGAHLYPMLLAALFTAYLTWSPWHYATQNHGVGLLMLARAGGPTTATATTTERRLLKGAHIALAIAAMVAIHSGLSEPFLRRVGFSPSVALAAAIAAASIAVVGGGSVLWRLRRRGAPMAGLVAVAFLLLASLVWFALPALLQVGNTLVYASGAAALLHCAQYLWITFDGLGWGATVVGLGVVMFTLGPWIASKAFGYDLIVSLLIVQSVVNLHHFVVDAFVWKLRDPALSKPLFSGRELAAAHREQVGNGKAVFATIAVTGLLMVAAVDVAQLAGTRVDADDTWRNRAAVLNDNDSRVWVQEAVAVQRRCPTGPASSARRHRPPRRGLGPP
jgi:hypothetical protein